MKWGEREIDRSARLAFRGQLYWGSVEAKLRRVPDQG